LSKRVDRVTEPIYYGVCNRLNLKVVVPEFIKGILKFARTFCRSLAMQAVIIQEQIAKSAVHY